MSVRSLAVLAETIKALVAGKASSLELSGLFKEAIERSKVEYDVPSFQCIVDVFAGYAPTFFSQIATRTILSSSCDFLEDEKSKDYNEAEKNVRYAIFGSNIADLFELMNSDYHIDAIISGKYEFAQKWINPQTSYFVTVIAKKLLELSRPNLV